MLGSLLPLFMVAFFLVLGFGIGTFVERRHLNDLARREQDYAHMTVTNLKTVPDARNTRETFMVTGEAVIATDYFKTFAAALRNIVGGEVRTYERLMTRARREACLRMLDQAKQRGAHEVYNVRLESSNIMSSSSRNKAASVEVFAFGTAVVRR